MNQILGHIPRSEVNSQILQSRWKDLNEYFQQETSERYTDVDDLMNNLSKKMDQNVHKENKNYNVHFSRILDHI